MSGRSRLLSIGLPVVGLGALAGGIYLVVDHAAAAGAPLSVADSLHRIDVAIVKQEVEAAGFKLVGEDKSLASAGDDHSLNVFQPAIRGKTDQFILKFQKPK